MTYSWQAQACIDMEAKARVCAPPCSSSEDVYGRLRRGTERAKDAPIIRQLFSSSPRDPRYHMLSYISQKFSQELRPHSHEPRAALFLNRFTRTLTIMYATNGLADVLGISAEELNGKSFYYCIQENCLQEAVRCLESAKANDSIAYLRFWFRDPRQDEHATSDQQIDGHSSADEDDGGVHLDEGMVNGWNERSLENTHFQHPTRRPRAPAEVSAADHPHWETGPGSISENSTDIDMHGSDGIFDQPDISQSSSTSLSTTDEGPALCQEERQAPAAFEVELEAVVSCTSDGLVVILRRARPLLPRMAQPTTHPVARPYANGLFASPWATNPVLPDCRYMSMDGQPSPVEPYQVPPHPTAAQAQTAAIAGAASEHFMRSIREVAVFAWALTGINGSLAQYGRGKPVGECIPPEGLLIWDPDYHAGIENRLPDVFGGNSNHIQYPSAVNGHNGNTDHRQQSQVDDQNGNSEVRYLKHIDDPNGNPHNGYQIQIRSHNGNSNGAGNDHPSMPERITTNPWLYEPRLDSKTWDRGLSNAHGGHDTRHYEDMRNLGS